MVGLVGSEFGTRSLGNRRTGNNFPIPVHPSRHPVHPSLGQITNDSQPAAHVAVEGAIAHGQFAFVARGQEQRTKLVGHGHEGYPAKPRLQIFLGRVFRATFEERLHLALQGLEGALDGRHVETDPQVLSQRAGIVDASGARKLRGQGKAPNILRTQCVYSQGGD